MKISRKTITTRAGVQEIERGAVELIIRPLDQKKQPWIILALAATVTVIHIVLLHLYGVTEWRTHHYAWYTISEGLLDCLIVYAMLCAWCLRSANLPHALLLGTVSMLAFYLSFFNYMYKIDDGVEFVHGILTQIAPFMLWSIMYRLCEKLEKKKASVICGVIWGLAVLAITATAVFIDSSMDWLFDYLIPATVIIFEGCACIWVSARKFQDEQERKKWMWRVWLGGLAIAVLLNSLYTNDLFVFLSDSCWGEAVYAAMPILYAMVFRLLMSRKWHDALKFVLYYAFCLFTIRVYWYGLFGLVMPILICLVESRDSNQNSRWFPVTSTLYTVAWAILSFFWDKRLREIVFDLGGPAVNIQLTERVDWLGYRLAAVKSYHAGNTYAFMKYFLKNGQPLDYWENQGYQLYYSDDFLGALTFQFGQIWLVIMVILVIVVAVLLLKKNMSLPQTMHRNRQYMGISYLIRAALSCVYIVTMTRWSGRDFPFNAEMLMDLLVLWIMLKGRLDSTSLAH